MWQEGFFIDHRFPWRISLLRAISSFWSDRRQLSCAPILRIQRLSKDRSGFFLRALCVLCGKVCSDFADPRLSAYIRVSFCFSDSLRSFASFAVKKFCSIARSTFVFLRALCVKKFFCALCVLTNPAPPLALPFQSRASVQLHARPLVSLLPANLLLSTAEWGHERQISNPAHTATGRMIVSS
jgi:hypothetical protein